MRIRLDARGWLSITIATWALLCAIVTLTGFGGRYHLLADDTSLVPALPSVSQASTHPTLGPLASYAAAADRPLFYPDRKPIAVHVPGQNSSAQPFNVVLTSIIMTPTMQMAIVQDTQTRQSYRARMRQALDGPYSGWKLVAMTPRSAVFDSGAQGRTTLVLRVFDGHGGEMPTRMGLTPQVVASGALGPPSLPNGTGTVVNSVIAPPPPPDVSVQQQSTDAANDAANAAAEAAQQAEQIRKRIEARRQQAQAQGADAPPPNEKR
jgi:general secretion pathway protein N